METLSSLTHTSPASASLAGNQSLSSGAQSLRYGVSITDGCIGWEETETLLGEIAETVRTGVTA